jgi:WD40 repeat protein
VSEKTVNDSHPEAHRDFRTTHWSIVLEAGGAGDAAHSALDHLCRTLWNLKDFTHSTLREATGDFARSVAFSPDGRWLAVAMLTQEVEIWDVQERRLVVRLRGHTWEVNAVAETTS